MNEQVEYLLKQVGVSRFSIGGSLVLKANFRACLKDDMPRQSSNKGKC